MATATFTATFTLVGSTVWTVPDGVTAVNVLVVAGGGGGGSGWSGGGGGGGVLSQSGYSVTPGASLTVTVGGGGAGGSASGDGSSGSDGGDSTFDALTAIGGGGGAGNLSAAVSGNAGGSGGGGGCASGAGDGGAGTSDQGSAGGDAYNDGTVSGGGGGGGAGAAGSAGSSAGGGTGGAGGTGVWSSISGTAINYGGGGGGNGAGAIGNTGVGGAGGVGGGGAGGGASGGSGSQKGAAGAPNSGGGGGASTAPSLAGGAGGSGGSGIVILSYVAATGWLPRPAPGPSIEDSVADLTLRRRLLIPPGPIPSWFPRPFRCNRIDEPKAASRRIVSLSPLIFAAFAASARGLYRIFNPAVYRFYWSDSAPPVAGSTPQETSTTLAYTSSATFADGTWYLSVSYFDGVLDSGFLPVGPNGQTYLTLTISGGVIAATPPSAPPGYNSPRKAPA